MLMNIEQAKKVVNGCKLVATKKSNGYGGKGFADLQFYSGKYGCGYTITSNRNTEYYIYDKNVISKSVYDGEYSVMDAVITSRTIKTVAYIPLRSLYSDMIWIKPTWQLDLDTVTGKTVLKRTDDYKPVTLAGRTLTICWHGETTNDELRAKIRRKMRTMLNENKAILINKEIDKDIDKDIDESRDKDVCNNVSIV